METNGGSRLTARQQAMVEQWEAHLAAEFYAQNVEATMETMTEHPHIFLGPLAADDAVGAEGVRSFYTEDFFPTIIEQVGYEIVPISRTVGEDRVVDEMVFKFIHSAEMPWMLPGVAPTGKRVEIPLIVIIAFKDGKIDSEHLYWDQASVLAQVGLLQAQGLPVAGVQAARMLARLSAPAEVPPH